MKNKKIVKEEKVEVNKSETNKKTDYMFAIFLIFLGTVFLLNTTGVIDWTIWTILWKFWPLLIVFAGLNIIFEGSKVLSVLLSIFAFVAFFLVLIWSLALLNLQNLPGGWNITSPTWFENVVTQEPELESKLNVERVEFTEVEKKNVDIEMGVGSLNITNEGIENHLELYSQYFTNLGNPDLDVRVDDEVLNINLDLGKQGSPFSLGGRTPKYLILLGSDEIPTDLNMSIGAGQSEIFLNNYNLDSMSIELGAGDVTSRLSNMFLSDLNIEIGAGNFLLELSDNISFSNTITVKVGAGKLTLDLPENVEYRVEGNLGIGSINTPDERISGFGKEFTEIKSEGYDSADNRFTIIADVGVGELVIK